MPKLIKTKVENEGRVTEEYAWVEKPRTRAWDVEEELKVVGQPVARVDATERVTGAARYSSDIQLPRMLHAFFLRSPHPHARVVGVDTVAAEAMPGVRAVAHAGTVKSNRFKRTRDLFNNPVRFVGDEVAVVIADSPEAGRAALRGIRVEYELLPFVLDAETATAADAPNVTPDGNLLNGKSETYARGNVDAALAEADVVVEGVFNTAAQVHSALETHACVADWDGQRLTIWESSQDIVGVRDRVAHLLGLDSGRVRVLATHVGGAFGNKSGAGKHTLLAAHFARQLRRPVRFVLDRMGENLATGQRSPTRQYLKLGARRDGTLTAIEVRSYSNLGAYAGWAPYVEGPAREVYACENVRTTSYQVFTHTPPFDAFRAPGFVEGTFALESLMDELAARLGLDPLELRLKNYARVAPESGKSYTSNGLLDAYQEGARAIGWERRARPPEERGPWRVGIGMASQMWYGAGAPPSYAIIKVNPDATATIMTATQDLGTGTRTVLCQIAAEELGLPLDRFSIEIADTQTGVFAGGSSGSMTASSVGPAVREAAADAREQLEQLAATYLKKRAGAVHLEGGLVRAPGVEKPLDEILKDLGDIQIIGRGSRNPNPSGYEIRSFGAQFAQVAVDIETGEVRVERVVAAHDAGRVLNPLTVSSQVEGGVLQGMGFALLEGRVLDASGATLNANLEGYHLPTIADAPDIETHMIDRADPLANNLGIKGVGEPPIIPTAGAIANAMAHATGIRFYETPITRDRVLNALAARESETEGMGELPR